MSDSGSPRPSGLRWPWRWKGDRSGGGLCRVGRAHDSGLGRVLGPAHAQRRATVSRHGGSLVNSPEVQDAIATTVTNAIEQQVDIEAVLNEVFAGVITDRPACRSWSGHSRARSTG